MKIVSIACFLGIAVARASADATTPQVSSADTEEVTDLKTYWDERAAEASFMTVAISEGFTYSQCIRGCNASSFNGNRKRCERDCEKLDQNGDTTRDRTANCLSCDGHKFGSRKWVRCMNACEARRDTARGVCSEATNSRECELWCIGGSAAREDCLDYFDGNGGSGRRRRPNNPNGFSNPVPRGGLCGGVYGRCAIDLECIGGICASYGIERGGDCDRSDQCVAGLICRDWVCTLPGGRGRGRSSAIIPVGGRCGASFGFCDTGLDCLNGVCTFPSTNPRRRDGRNSRCPTKLGWDCSATRCCQEGECTWIGLPGSDRYNCQATDIVTE